MLLYDISVVRPEQSQPRVLTDCGSLCPTPSTALQPCSLSKNKQTTHCKLDLAATHDVVQERMHLVYLHGGEEAVLEQCDPSTYTLKA